MLIKQGLQLDIIDDELLLERGAYHFCRAARAARFDWLRLNVRKLYAAAASFGCTWRVHERRSSFPGTCAKRPRQHPLAQEALRRRRCQHRLLPQQLQRRAEHASTSSTRSCTHEACSIRRRPAVTRGRPVNGWNGTMEWECASIARQCLPYNKKHSRPCCYPHHA